MKRFIFTRKSVCSFPSMTCVTVVPLHDLHRSRMWRPSRTWWDGNRWRGWRVDGCGGCQSRGHQVSQNVEQETTTNKGQIMWKPKLAESFEELRNSSKTPHPFFWVQIVISNWALKPGRSPPISSIKVTMTCVTTRLHIFRPPRYLFMELALWSFGRKKKLSQLVARCQFRTSLT